MQPVHRYPPRFLFYPPPGHPSRNSAREVRRQLPQHPARQAPRHPLRPPYRRLRLLLAASFGFLLTACPPIFDPPDDDEIDSDEDGYTLNLDCDDQDSSIYPEAAEVPYNGVDEDCSGADLIDVDGDGHASILTVGGDDCNDNAASVYPGAEEVCDGMANGCDAFVDDLDQDGYAGEACSGADCDDSDPSIYPFAAEVAYDGIDQDCDRLDDRDVDGDGEESVLVGGTDCDDSAETGGEVDSTTEVLIPAGVFWMGSDDHDDSESPQHSVYLSGYCIDLYEVSNRAYEAHGGVLPDPPGWSSSYFSDVAYDAYPVLNVDWQAAQSYCESLGKSLPTEAQWEKAARGGECLEGDGDPACLEGGSNPDPTRTYPWGEVDDTHPLTCDYANFTQSGDAGACTDPSGVRTTAVGEQAAGRSPYGVYNLSGNVSEWVHDWYNSTYYDDSSVMQDPQGPETGDFRVYRGGGYAQDAGEIRAAKRFSSDSYSQSLGFRCARNIAWP